MPNRLRRSGPNPAPGLSPDAPLHSLRYVVLDTELTSLDHRTNRLLSVGAIVMQGPSIRLGEQFYRVVNPQVSIQPVLRPSGFAWKIRESGKLSSANPPDPPMGWRLAAETGVPGQLRVGAVSVPPETPPAQPNKIARPAKETPLPASVKPCKLE